MREGTVSIFTFVVVSLAAGYITFTLVFSGIASGFRGWIDSWSLSDFGAVRFAGHHLHLMLGCPFCTGFWVVLPIQAVFQFNAVGHGWLGVLLTWPAITLATAFLAFAAGHAVNHLPPQVEYLQNLGRGGSADERSLDALVRR